MAPWLRRISSSLLALALAGAGTFAPRPAEAVVLTALTAEEEAFFERHKGKILLGMELELSRENLERMVSIFDFNRYQSEHPEIVERLPVEMVDNYLDDSLNFARLPAAVRETLSAGLGSLRPNLEAPSVPERSANARLVDPRGQALAPVSEGSRLVLPETNTGIKIPGAQAPKPASEGLRISGNARAQLNFEAVQARWRAMPLAERRKLVSLEYLPARDRASLLTDHTSLRDNATITTGTLWPKRNLPAPVAALLERLLWKPDGEGVLEFKHRQPLSDPRQVLEDIHLLARLAGVEKGIEHPLAPLLHANRPELAASLHLHVSFPGKNAEAVSSATIAKNLLKLIEGAESGVNYFITFEGRRRVDVSYQDTTNKGLIREVGPGHVEQRAQIEKPQIELRRVIEEIDDPALVYRRLGARLREGQVERLLRNLITMNEYGRQFFEVQAGRLFKDLESLRPYCPDCSLAAEAGVAAFRKLLNDPNPSVRQRAAALAIQVRGLPEPLQALVTQIMDTTEPEALARLSGAFRVVDTPPMRRLLARWMEPASPLYWKSIALSLVPPDDPHLMESLFRLSRDSDDSLAEAAVKALARAQTKGVRARLLADFQASPAGEIERRLLPLLAHVAQHGQGSWLFEPLFRELESPISRNTPKEQGVKRRQAIAQYFGAALALEHARAEGHPQGAEGPMPSLRRLTTILAQGRAPARATAAAALSKAHLPEELTREIIAALPKIGMPHFQELLYRIGAPKDAVAMDRLQHLTEWAALRRDQRGAYGRWKILYGNRFPSSAMRVNEQGCLRNAASMLFQIRRRD